MTNTIETRASSSVHGLRAALERAERQVLHLDRSNIEAFLELLDEIEQAFVEFGPDQSELRAEEGRWVSLRNRIIANPQVVVSAAAQAGGLAKLRSQHPPATGPWWHLDAMVAQRRTQMLKRAAVIVAAVVLVAAAIWGINAFTSTPGSQSNVTPPIEELVTAQKFPEALTAVEQARLSLPDDPDLLIWEAVLAEQVGDTARAETSLAQAQQTFDGQPAAFWTLVGNRRQQVGNLQGAEQAGLEALALAPQDASVTFLLGSVAEARGDVAQAVRYFSETVTLAGDTNPQLSVIAKVRLGNLSQQVDPLAGETITQTLPPPSQ